MENSDINKYDRLENLEKENQALKNQVEDLKILYTNLAEHNTVIENELDEKLKIIEAANKKIRDSVIYAKRIQTAILPNIETLINNFPQSFILHRSKDIVSGDFYWFKQKDNKFLIAAVDCTGHGVPGAFMSMLGVAFLNDIVLKNDYNSAADILEKLRDLVKTSLKQNINSVVAKDGMDLSLCIIDKNENNMQFAGANNQLFLIRDKQLNIYRGTKSPIGVHLLERPFENHNIEIFNNDLIYLFSDGYYDQMNPNNRKFRINNFKKLIVEISEEPMQKQKIILESTHDKWREYIEQLDDILIIGLKIN